MYQGLKLRIYPNLEQQKQIVENFGAARFVWNQMLEMQSKRYKNNKDSKFLNGFAMNFLVKQLKTEYSWLKQAESTSLQDTCETLAVAFQRFFKKLGGYPKFKSRKFPKQRFKSKCINNNVRLIDNHYLKLPKLGIMKYRGKFTNDKIKSITIQLSPTGKFYCVLLIECENQTQFGKTSQAVGLDMGIADLISTSDAVKYPTIRFDQILAKKKHYWEKRLARRREQAKKEIAWDKHNKVVESRELAGFKNYTKAKQMVAKYNEKIANQRKDYLHKITTGLVRKYDKIVIEDLKTNNMIKNHKLASAIANQSWRMLRLMLEYKCKWYGKALSVVNPYKTSQLCFNCGYDAGKHELDIRVWTCPQCHTQLDRDVNASKNILKLGLG
ncbi:RNA-guided endonuclease TnpB family protein [Lactobacillus sp. UCMA15818]|uniref:RNA-guided endonuclease TnpB family protein n=1 Tax=Lactobacillus sp. UCMA15818 TaxID=2583394 RepID=UPI0025B07919|nr:RNA-guided endonuclease TnpB family protein [Lactobacillus sp. UCMA15818]MDN2453474.1 IS200/IS605 family element transposase accessory protein TnpB [Lactobacillus sp. UCMA15818]